MSVCVCVSSQAALVDQLRVDQTLLVAHAATNLSNTGWCWVATRRAQGGREEMPAVRRSGKLALPGPLRLCPNLSRAGQSRRAGSERNNSLKTPRVSRRPASEQKGKFYPLKTL